ncbi:MAG: hypothetical protein ACLQNE_02870 [Thermoguttaceae bacterium]
MVNNITDNPYQSPSQPGRGADPSPMVRLPALSLIGLAAISMLAIAANGFTLVIDNMRFLEAYGTREGLSKVLPIDIGFTVVLAAHLVILFGAFQMCRIRRYRLAKTAAIISLVPLCSPLVILGMPFGIWALVVLSRPNVKSAFRENDAKHKGAA